MSPAWVLVMPIAGLVITVLVVLFTVSNLIRDGIRRRVGPWRGTWILNNTPRSQPHHCRLPRASSRRRRDQWRCETCDRVYRQHAVHGGFGDVFWIWKERG
jgi:hypothetical protein